jgi:hypothetical protein
MATERNSYSHSRPVIAYLLALLGRWSSDLVISGRAVLVIGGVVR